MPLYSLIAPLLSLSFVHPIHPPYEIRTAHTSSSKRDFKSLNIGLMPPTIYVRKKWLTCRPTNRQLSPA